jgi:formate dehydrogenase
MGSEDGQHAGAAGYLTPDRISKAKKLKLALTAGIGSDHVDLPAAAEAGITVAEVTGATRSHMPVHHLRCWQ